MFCQAKLVNTFSAVPKGAEEYLLAVGTEVGDKWLTNTSNWHTMGYIAVDIDHCLLGFSKLEVC